MKINKKSNMRGPICGLLAVCMSLQLFAAEVTPEQAQTAAENWIRLSPRRMGSTFRSCNAEEMETVRGDTGRAVFHAFNFKGGGFVAHSAEHGVRIVSAAAGLLCVKYEFHIRTRGAQL